MAETNEDMYTRDAKARGMTMEEYHAERTKIMAAIFNSISKLPDESLVEAVKHLETL